MSNLNSVVLSPTDVNYVSSKLVFDQFEKNQLSINLATGITNVIDNPSSILLDGTSRGYLIGEVTVTGGASISADMVLGSLPSKLVPIQNFDYPVTVYRSGSPITNYVKVVGTSGSSELLGVQVIETGIYNGTTAVATLHGPGTGGTVQTHMTLNAIFVNNVIGEGGYAPGDTITFTGGTFTQATVLTVGSTELFAATISDPGTLGTPGAVVLTGTTGTGTKFQINGTIGGGGSLASLGSITVGGNYTVNPTNLSAEPVTGGNLVAASLTITMIPVDTNYIVTQAGDYTAVPTNPITPTTSGSGHGITYSPHWQVASVQVTNPGSGYTNASTITFSSGIFTATGNLLLDTKDISSILLVNQPTAGDVVCLNGVNFFTQSYS